jgi:hypothetical protein
MSDLGDRSTLRLFQSHWILFRSRDSWTEQFSRGNIRTAPTSVLPDMSRFRQLHHEPSENPVSRQLAEPLVREADCAAKCSRSMLDERIGDLSLIEIHTLP